MKKKKEINSRYFWSNKVFIISLLSILIVFLLFLSLFNNKILLFSKIFIKNNPTAEPSPTILDELDKPQSFDSKEMKAKYIALAIDDLAKKLNIGKNEIKLLNIERKNWPDTSLGCPEEGKMYAQMVTPGYQIILSFKNANYIYNAGLGKVVSCLGN